jgi:aryl-alcohol dehydrogenase-like predicted oxidoreductase
MKYRSIGVDKEPLSSIGLGCMVMNHGYGKADIEGSITTMEKALELGINFWDTADMYANGENEKLVARVLKPNRNKIFIATKFGFRNENGNLVIDGSPAYVHEAVDASLERLGVDVIDLYYLHRIDPNIPVEETVGAMAGLVKAGKVRHIGLSEVSVKSLKRACEVHPISALQSEYSILSRDVEKDIIPACVELGITFVPFSPLSRGLITNKLDVSGLDENDFRKGLPRYQPEYKENNQNLAVAFEALAETVPCTSAQLALAWILGKGDHIIPIPGTKRVKYLVENAEAADIQLSEAHFKAIDDLLARYPDTGPRYSEAHLKFVDQ